MNKISVQKQSNIVADMTSLRKRMSYFCGYKTTTQEPLLRFIKKLFPMGGVYIFGGVVRDIAIKGLEFFCSDVDIVFDRTIDLSDINAKVTINKFGGYRIIYRRWVIDAWHVKNTWAFKNGFVKHEDISSLLDTTITNYESVLFDVSKNKIICKSGYIKDINEGYLTLVNNNTPSIMGSLKKIIKIAYKCEVKNCDFSVARFFSVHMKNSMFTSLLIELSEAGVPYYFSSFFIKKSLMNSESLLPYNIEHARPFQNEFPFA